MLLGYILTPLNLCRHHGMPPPPPNPTWGGDPWGSGITGSVSGLWLINKAWNCSTVYDMFVAGVRVCACVEGGGGH